MQPLHGNAISISAALAILETIEKDEHADRAEAEEKEHIFIIAQAYDDIARYRFSADKLARFRRLIDM